MFKENTEIFYNCPDDLKSGWYNIDRIRRVEGEKDVYLISNEYHTIETTARNLASQPAYMEENWDELEDTEYYDD